MFKLHTEINQKLSLKTLDSLCTVKGAQGRERDSERERELWTNRDHNNNNEIFLKREPLIKNRAGRAGQIWNINYTHVHTLQVENDNSYKQFKSPEAKQALHTSHQSTEIRTKRVLCTRARACVVFCCHVGFVVVVVFVFFVVVVVLVGGGVDFVGVGKPIGLNRSVFRTVLNAEQHLFPRVEEFKVYIVPPSWFWIRGLHTHTQNNNIYNTPVVTRALLRVNETLLTPSRSSPQLLAGSSVSRCPSGQGMETGPGRGSPQSPHRSQSDVGQANLGVH